MSVVPFRCCICNKRLLSRLSSSIKATRWYSQTANRAPVPSAMSAWTISRYGGIPELSLSDLRTPVITSPGDVLVEVCAASVNPIDVMLIDGYGSRTLNTMRRARGVTTEFPLIPGRDFSGVVIATGQAVPPSLYKPGDEVWGAGEAWQQGTHSQYLTVSAKQISPKPRSISHTEASSLPYVAATTWSAVCTFGCQSPGSVRGKRVLVLGGSGGIGNFAIQLLKAWGADVVTTCSTDAISTVLELGADIAIDYKNNDAYRELQELNAFDLILDGTNAGPGPSLKLLKKYSNAKYISFVTPFLRNNDEIGLPFGLLKTGISFGLDNIQAVREGQTVRYALFLPNGRAMREVAALVDSGKIRPMVEKVFPFSALPEAYEKVAGKHSRGKTVIDVRGTT